MLERRLATTRRRSFKRAGRPERRGFVIEYRRVGSSRAGRHAPLAAPDIPSHPRAPRPHARQRRQPRLGRSRDDRARSGRRHRDRDRDHRHRPGPRDARRGAGVRDPHRRGTPRGDGCVEHRAPQRVGPRRPHPRERRRSRRGRPAHPRLPRRVGAGGDVADVRQQHLPGPALHGPAHARARDVLPLPEHRRQQRQGARPTLATDAARGVLQALDAPRPRRHPRIDRRARLLPRARVHRSDGITPHRRTTSAPPRTSGSGA